MKNYQFYKKNKNFSKKSKTKGFLQPHQFIYKGLTFSMLIGLNAHLGKPRISTENGYLKSYILRYNSSPVGNTAVYNINFTLLALRKMLNLMIMLSSNRHALLFNSTGRNIEYLAQT